MIKDLLNVTLASIGSIVILFILTKIMGNKQMSQLSMFDYINGITIGSIAAEMATSLEEDFMKPLLAMVIYALVAFGISIWCCKSIKARRFFIGCPMILYENGKLYKKNLLTAKIDIEDFLTQARSNGYFNIADVGVAVLEVNGKISFLPKSDSRPVTPSDMNMQPDDEYLVSNIIIDGNIMEGNLKHCGKNETWLKAQLEQQGYDDVKQIFLATCDRNDNLSVYPMIREKIKKDIFN